MSEEIGPEIEFYDSFRIADSFRKFITGGDLGGRKERLVLYGQDEGGNIEKIMRVNWDGEDVENVADMFTRYHAILEQNKLARPEEAVLGCAGIIEDGGTYCNFTNIGLEVSTKELEGMGVHAELINDFFANAQEIPWLKDDEKEEISHKYEPENPKASDSRTMVVLGPGSGLGVAPIYWDKERGYYPKPSEGGHKAWCPRNDMEWALYKYLKAEVTDGRDPDQEVVASGKGLPNIAKFLCYGDLPKSKSSKKIDRIKKLRKDKELQKFVKALSLEEPPVAGRAIVQAYSDKVFRSMLRYAVDIFVDSVAAAARDAVHDFCAYGGVYIAGGHTRRLRRNFLSGRFMNVFDQSYEHTDKLRSTPAYIVTSGTLGTDGAARYALSRKRD